MFFPPTKSWRRKGKNKMAKGTAAMSKEVRTEVARKGGIAASRDRARMAEIGRKGGLAVSANKAHMAEIGRKGGSASQKKKVDSPESSG